MCWLCQDRRKEGTVLSFEKRLRELGIDLPEPPAPVAAYVPVVQTGNLVFVSGQAPTIGGKPLFVGRLGSQIDVSQGQAAARLAMINCLAQLKGHIGSLDRVTKIVKVLGFVACIDDFDQHPSVMDGASQLLQEVFGESGQHARTTVGTNKLPFGIPVEIELIAEVQYEVTPICWTKNRPK